MNNNLKEALKAGIIGGVISGVISLVLNYFVFPVPISEIQNALGNGVSGLMGGLFSGTVGVLIVLKKVSADSVKA